MSRFTSNVCVAYVPVSCIRPPFFNNSRKDFLVIVLFFGHRPLRRTLHRSVHYSSMCVPLSYFSFLIPYFSSFNTTGDCTNSFNPSGSTAFINSLGLL